MVGTRIIPQRVNVDIHESLMQPDMARFLKNVSYDIQDTSSSTSEHGGQTGVLKPLESNERYITNLVLPEGYNHVVGVFPFKETKEVYVMVYNDHYNHIVYRLNGSNQTYDILFQSPLWNFQLTPEYFIHSGACCLEIIYLTDPVTGKKLRRSFLIFTDGYNPQRQICVEDAINTSGFNDTLFPYFVGTYDRSLLINMGVPTPKDCIEINEVEPDASITESNRLLFNTWQFRILYTDVWGRPSEHGIISDQYLPGAGNCNPSSANLPRCLDLVFNAPPPYIDSIQIEYRNCNEQLWKKAETINLYDGSPIGEWWKRERNVDIQYEVATHKITYRFCADKECETIPTNETNRLDNPLPRTSVGAIPIDKYLALSNNKDGFLPFDKLTLKKIHPIVTSPSDADPANSNVRNATILVEIWNRHFGSQPIYKQGITGSSDLAYGFGQWTGPYQYRSFFAYQQYFKNRNQKGFVGYFAGTDAYTISSEWLLDEVTGSFTEITEFDHPTPAYIDSKKRYFHRFDFTNIPKGTYIFRIASHNSDPSVNKNYQQTSTYVWGQFAYVWRSGTNPVNTPNAVSDVKELVIDVCTKNFDSRTEGKILTIYDPVNSDTVVQQGYVKNTDETDEFQVGMELMKISVSTGFDAFIDAFTDYTDHNGFYWIAGEINNVFDTRFTYRILGACGCDFGEQFKGKSGTNPETYTNDYFMNKSNCPDYQGKICSFVKIKGKIKGCGTNIGIPNVGVVLARGMSTKTDENGEFTIIAHDDIRTGHRGDSLYFITNSCGFTGCDNGCLVPYYISFDQCTGCSERLITVPDVGVMFFDIVRGLLSGGSYPLFVCGGDWLGRRQFAQPLGNIKIPSFQNTKSFTPSVLSIQMDGNTSFPDWVDYITFFIGAETTIDDYVTWIVDDVQFIDNTGLVNEVAPSQIKIYYSSLLEFNKQNEYNTTVNWAFIDTGTTEPTLTDKVQFYINGDGQFFDKQITALVKYDKVGKYFLINYTNDLKNLKSNAIIRLERPKVCTGLEPVYEIPCSEIDVINGFPQKLNVALNVYDTYYQKRQIPVPVLQTPANPNATPPTVDVFANELRILGVPFEHKSVSDFWGKNCWNVGRVNSKNPYETEIYSINQIALSGSISTTGLLNYLNYFDTTKKISFSESNLNGIVSVLSKTGFNLIVGQNNSVLVGFNDNLLRVNSAGQVAVNSIENTFGKPQQTPGANYGCLIFDKNTIYEKDGFVHWLDATKSWVIQHNFSICQPISTNGADGHVRPKIKAVQQYNNTHDNKRYFHAVINPAGTEYLLSDFIIRSDIYVNELREANIDHQETLVFGVISKWFRGWQMCTPERFSELEGEVNDQQLFSFKNGIPYKHYSTITAKTFNTFFGVIGESIMETVVVVDGFIKKRPLAIGQYCKQGLYFVDRVITETGQQSRILIPHWLQANYGHYAPFLCDLNTLADPIIPKATGDNKILDGNQLVGTWVKVRFVSSPDMATKYSEFQGVTVNVFGEK